jgi:hypothetical protein
MIFTFYSPLTLPGKAGQYNMYGPDGQVGFDMVREAYPGGALR